MKWTFRIWLLIILLLLSVLAIKPSFETGAVVKSVEKNSSIFEAGLRTGDIIKSVNGEAVKSAEQYGQIVENYFADNNEKRIDIVTKSSEYTLLTNEAPKITVADVPSTRIQTGLDLRGGARALVQPDAQVTDAQMQDLIEVSRNRFNVYGLSDIQLRAIKDSSGNRYMVVDVAGATPTDLQDLISKQGNFEAEIGNGTNAKKVFEGGKGDISDVCRNRAECAGITACDSSQSGGHHCSFRFAVYLTPEAAKRQADITQNISLNERGDSLSEKIYLYVDGKEVDSLGISSDLKGKVATTIEITGPGDGATREDAIKDAQTNMKKLQTVLITGSLPYKLNIVKLDTISPNLGDSFTYLLLIAGGAAMLAVAAIVFLRYRNLKASLAMLFTSFSEIVIILGIAALIKWNLDLPSIAGILATIGTGVDQQIVILDESQRGKALSLIEKMKRALFIVVSSFFTAAVSLIPLYWAVAGLFKGFAITTLIGITVGVLISRPAFSDMLKKMEN